MTQEQRRRQRRIPLTREEVEAIIAYKQRKEQLQLHKLKKSRLYMACNIFNVACFFVFCELIFCYFGPSTFFTHYTKEIKPSYGTQHTAAGKHILEELDIKCVDNDEFKVLVEDYIAVPKHLTTLNVGSDYLLGRELKASIDGAEEEYRLFSASPVLFLSMLASVILLLAICYNLNENEYSLWGLTTVSGMTLLCVVFM